MDVAVDSVTVSIERLLKSLTWTSPFQFSNKIKDYHFEMFKDAHVYQALQRSL